MRKSTADGWTSADALRLRPQVDSGPEGFLPPPNAAHQPPARDFEFPDLDAQAEDTFSVSCDTGRQRPLPLRRRIKADEFVVGGRWRRSTDVNSMELDANLTARLRGPPGKLPPRTSVNPSTSLKSRVAFSRSRTITIPRSRPHPVLFGQDVVAGVLAGRRALGNLLS